MGQYYRIFTQFDDLEIRIFELKLYFNLSGAPDTPDWATEWLKEDSFGDYYPPGLKLMEHSWLDSRFMRAFNNYLYEHHPMRVVWCGDYATPKECNDLGFCYNWIWKRDAFRERLIYEGEKNVDKFKYFVNKSKNLYLDLEKYRQECTDEEGWCISPISLLTALGNDRGGGDFHKGCIGYESVGTWAGDYVTILEEKPSGCEEFNVRFIEREEVNEA